ncbi:Gfo/Idh/MocA family oxidoreductase [Sporolactobacillus sp. CPB3-1]|uniref:Gfo/Idh/MocA family oxidoreductase n=1 Tax=Sporolactobacillus mangiferae TaxID=2940498 RepID=A0ABT0MB19_9BACL|nr:Gfo/Idh/MocA family oxidoreductase [Sporolactobacillus mangiferae]MCL1631798.1 Gfo/Idh/MocA family oxidoreductase [Sporolactobacillus mangiferae]
MIKVGVIGIGSIALKAYIPVYASIGDVDFYFCTRNPKTLEKLHEKYRWDHIFTNIDEWLNQGIQAAFVHAATVAHPEIIERLIHEGVSVYTDKPLADNFESAAYLTKLADNAHVYLFTGFNRRFAPMIARAADLPDKTMIICQKNRINAAGDLRTIVFDDFIHVVDTARFLLNRPIDKYSVSISKNKENLCTGIILNMQSGNVVASAIMNRVSGANQELIQVMSKHGELLIRDLTECEWIQGKQRQIECFDDWCSTLHKRGFEQIVQSFLNTVRSGQQEPILKGDALETHRICEQVVTRNEPFER